MNARKAYLFAWLASLGVALIAGQRIFAGAWFGALTLCIAWFSGFAFHVALDVYRKRLELEQQAEQARFVRVQLDAIERDLTNPDPATRAAARRRLLELDPYAQVPEEEVRHVDVH